MAYFTLAELEYRLDVAERRFAKLQQLAWLVAAPKLDLFEIGRRAVNCSL